MVVGGADGILNDDMTLDGGVEEENDDMDDEKDNDGECVELYLVSLLASSDDTVRSAVRFDSPLP